MFASIMISVLTQASLGCSSGFSQLLTKINSHRCLLHFRQSVFRFCARRLQCDLLSTFAIQSISRAEISAKFENTYLPLQTLNLVLGLLQFVVSWLRRRLPLILRSNLIGFR